MKQTCLLSTLGALVLAAVALPSCSDEAPAQDRSAQAQAGLATVVEGLAGYHALHGEWPPSLSVLVRPDADGNHFLPGGTASTFDPWGNALAYERTADGYALASLGSDGAVGGSGAAADLDSAGPPAPATL